MLIVVTGGSGSGKSAYAEEQILAFGERKRYYIATMQCADEESERRIKRHRAMRANRQFETIECQRDLERLTLPIGSVALLECMSNLAANEFFDGREHTAQETADKILAGLARLCKQCSHVVVVTNEVFCAGHYDGLTNRYLQCLGRINCVMAQRADRVTEVIYGIPVLRKGEKI